MPTALSSSPPVLPIPRQPSPLSFSSVSIQDPPSPPASTSSHIISGVSLSSSPASSRVLHSVTSGPAHPGPFERRDSQPLSPTVRTDLLPKIDGLPIEPLPDSLLLRSTFNALDHSAATLKRLSKAVLSATSTYLALLEQVEKAEEDVFSQLGELGRWLESGYGVSGPSVWDDERGVRRVRKDARRREREEMEIMVEHGVRAVKGELKRNGLAGGGAQGRFEQGAKQFYTQTSEYLTPQASAQAGPSGSPHTQSASSQTVASSSGDLAQASRLAQFDLARYSHHSTLLYAVPPTSITCLDLLVGLYSWAGGLLGEQPELRKPSFTRRESQLSIGTTTPREAEPSSAENTMSNDRGTGTPNPRALKESLSISLARLSTIRADLLVSWAKRNSQTTELEEIAAERVAEQEGTIISELPSPRWVDMSSAPMSTTGIEHKKGKKMHKLHRSVGGRLRGLLSSSGSSNNLAAAEQKRPASDRTSRSSFDSHYARPEILRTIPLQVAAPNGHAGPIPPQSKQTSQRPAKNKDEVFKVPALPTPNPAPARRPSTTSPRPMMQPRHSMHVERTSEYVSPFIASQAAFQDGTMGIESSPDLRIPDTPGLNAAIVNTTVRGVGGVGGLGAGGDEDERREEVGRKKEGVLWGAGVWEGLSKSSGKAKWENFWVVLDRSSIYEYRDNNLVKPDAAHAVIDLKFASVREGRGTDRRFVFEIVTPSQGRRLYQATSEQEMKQWLYAICNAIESCINGTSSVRTFDASKLRTVSGSLDDHALPTRRLLGGQPRGLGLGLGLPMPSMSSNLGGRRSMPPPPRPGLGGDAGDRRQRKTSLKKVLRQSAEIAGEKWSNVMARNSSGLDLPRPSFLGQAGRSVSRSSNEDGSSGARPQSMMLHSPSYSRLGTDRGGVAEEADDIEQRVLEMAGLGLGDLPVKKNLDGEGSTSSGRRVVSEGVSRSMTLAKLEGLPSADMSRTRSADPGIPPVPPLPPKDALAARRPDSTVDAVGGEAVDMRMLRRIADLPENRQCADCRKGMKSSRWATLSLREYPMVIFLCIRCVGVHRGLGTHISKPRSVDLDIWTPDSIRLAMEWGNERGNAVWEELRVNGAPVDDAGIAEFIRHKYVEGVWVGQAMRGRLGLPVQARVPAGGQVGTAI